MNLEGVAGRLVAIQNSAVEAACERMLTDPRGWGVLVTTTYASFDPASGKIGASWSVDLSPDVPFGEIHYKEVQR